MLKMILRGCAATALALSTFQASAQKYDQYYLGTVKGERSFIETEVTYSEPKIAYGVFSDFVYESDVKRTSGEKPSVPKILQEAEEDLVRKGFVRDRLHFLPIRIKAVQTYTFAEGNRTETRRYYSYELSYLYQNPPPKAYADRMAKVHSMSLGLMDLKVRGEPYLVQTVWPDLQDFSIALDRGKLGLDGRTRYSFRQMLKAYSKRYGVPVTDLDLNLVAQFKTESGELLVRNLVGQGTFDFRLLNEVLQFQGRGRFATAEFYANLVRSGWDQLRCLRIFSQAKNSKY